MDKTFFSELNAVNVNEMTEQKNGLTYLSWAWAYTELMKRYPDAVVEIKTFDGKPYLYDENLGYMVMTSITLDGVTRTMWLPVMDGANKAMKAQPYTYLVKNKNYRYAKRSEDGLMRDNYGNVQEEYTEKTVEAATMFDINTALMRCLVKNISLFGLGLYIYAGEDLPPEERIGAQEVAVLNRLLEEAKGKIDQQKFMQYFDITEVEQMKAKRFNEACRFLDKAIQTRG